MGKKRAIIEIAQILSEAGYDINYTIVGIPGSTGIYSLAVVQADKTKICVYSNDSKHTGAVINHSPKTKVDEIIEKIVANFN